MSALEFKKIKEQLKGKFTIKEFVKMIEPLFQIKDNHFQEIMGKIKNNCPNSLKFVLSKHCKNCTMKIPFDHDPNIHHCGLLELYNTFPEYSLENQMEHAIYLEERWGDEWK